MKAEEYIKKFSEEMRAVHKKAAALNATLERKEQAELREKLKAQRAALSNVSDDEGAERAKKGKGLNPEEIIENGTPEERAALIISDTDNYKAYGIPQKLSEEDKRRLQINLNKRPAEERSVFLFYVKEYDRMCKYYLRLHNYLKAYQVEATLLAKLVTKWEDYDREAEACTKEYRDFQDKNLWTASDGRTILTTEAEEFFIIYRNIILKAHSDWKDATLIFDEATQTFKADVDGEGKLYEQITQQAEETTETLSQFKAAAKVAEDYVLEEVAYFVEPLQMENTIEAVKDERYIRYYGGPKKYLRSELNYKKIDKGLPVTEEEEKRAVFPDYYEVEPNENTLRYAKEYLYKIM